MFVLLRQQAKSSVKVTYLLDYYEADCLLPADSCISQRQAFGIANHCFSSRHAPSALVCSFRLLELTGEDPRTKFVPSRHRATDPRRIVVDGAGGNFFCLRVYRRQEECKKANNYTQRAERRRSWIDPSIQFPRKVT